MNEFEYYQIYPKRDLHIPTVVESPKKYVRDNSWELYGKPIPDPEPTSFICRKPVKYSKLIVGDHFWGPESVFSKKVADVLAPMNIRGIQLIPTIVRINKRELYNGFYYIHIHHYIKALDKQKSDFEYVFEYENYCIYDLVLDRKALAKIPLKERLIFKMEEDGESLYHRLVVDAIMATDPLGIVFGHCETKKSYKYGEE